MRSQRAAEGQAADWKGPSPEEVYVMTEEGKWSLSMQGNSDGNQRKAGVGKVGVYAPFKLEVKCCIFSDL